MTRETSPLARALKRVPKDLEPRAEQYWEGRLDDWLLEVLNINLDSKKQPDNLQTWSFPADGLKREYLSTVVDRDEREVRILLRHFLFDASTFVSDDDLLWSLNRRPEKLVELQERYEYFRRLPLTAFGAVHAQAGVRWVLDLLPDSPGQAITVVKSYGSAHITSLTSGRKDGLRDAIDLIYAYYINRNEETRQEALMNISPRQFELLVAHLYRRMEFSVMVTRPTRDGGRDVIATKSGPGEKQKLLIECKQYQRPVTVKEARALLGVVGHENASGGVMVTVGRCTRGVHQLANTDDRFECIDGGNLVLLLNKYFGTEWPQRINWLADPAWAISQSSPAI